MVAFFCPPPFMRAGSAPFPVVEGGATSQMGSNSNPHIVTLPAGIQAGEVLLILAAVQASGITVGNISGWNKIIELQHSDGTTGVMLAAFARLATGSEGSSVSFTTSANRASAHNSYRISGASVDLEHSAVGGGSNAPNPPPLSPSWGSKNTLWLTGTAIRSGISGEISAAPADYEDLQNIVSGGTATISVRMASANRELAAATEDPGSFTMSSVQDWVAATIAIQPA